MLTLASLIDCATHTIIPEFQNDIVSCFVWHRGDAVKYMTLSQSISFYHKGCAHVSGKIKISYEISVSGLQKGTNILTNHTPINLMRSRLNDCSHSNPSRGNSNHYYGVCITKNRSHHTCSHARRTCREWKMCVSNSTGFEWGFVRSVAFEAGLEP